MSNPQAPNGHATGTRTYIAIAIALAVITYIEVQTPNFMAHGPALVVTLLAMAIVKAGLVMAFYMHMKGDSRVYTGIMVLALILVAYFLALLVLPVQGL